MAQTKRVTVVLVDDKGNEKEGAIVLKKMNVGEYQDYARWAAEQKDDIGVLLEMIRRSVVESTFPPEENSKLDLNSIMDLAELIGGWYGPLFDRAKRMFSTTSSSDAGSRQGSTPGRT
jgi:hypothetical protein